MNVKLTLFVVLFFSFVQGQILVSGRCLDAANQAIPRVTVMLLENSRSTFSDEKGFFRLQLDELDVEEATLLLKKEGYQSLHIPLQFSDETIDLGDWQMRETLLEDIPLPLVDFNEQLSLLADAGSRTYGSNLQSWRTPFLAAASFQFSAAFFSLRGLDRNHQIVRMNGITMNDEENGRAPWAVWGGLNDITNRSQLTQHGLAPYGDYFGGVLGSTELFIRPSDFRKSIKFSQALANRTYRLRSMLTYHSAPTKNGWAVSAMGSFRQGSSGFHTGTKYEAYSALLSVEKIWKGDSSSWITAWYSPVERGRNAPLTQEVFDHCNVHYNPYWGEDKDIKRNSRISRVEIPSVILNHQQRLSKKSKMLLSLAYQKGEQGNSRILYTGVRPLGTTFIGGGRNPDPVYYQNLPSYFLQDPATSDFEAAYRAQHTLVTDGQINWASMRMANHSISDGSARYAVYEDVKQSENKSAALQLFHDPSPGSYWNITLAYRNSQANYFAQPIDFLGATHVWDIDPYAETDTAQFNNLMNATPKTGLYQPFIYHYAMHSTRWEASSIWYKSGRLGAVFLGTKYSHQSHQREGYFQQGAFPENSHGRGQNWQFKSWSAKAGIEFSFSPRHRLTFHAGQYQRPPNLRSLYPNPRQSHTVISNPKIEQTQVIESSFHWQGKTFDFDLTVFWAKQVDQNQLSFYFADGVGGDEAFFVQEMLSGLSTLHQGLELGWKVTIAQSLDLMFAAALGKHQFANSPQLDLYTSPTETAKKQGFDLGYKNFGQANLKGYHLSNGPQQAFSIGWQYNDPNYWRIAMHLNYMSHAYIQPNPLRRTASFRLDQAGLPLENIDENHYAELMAQERFSPFYLLNATAGKSWKIKQNYLGFFASFQNLLNQTYMTGGFEQGRNANYTKALEDHQRTYPLFGPKYWWGRGTTFFISTYYRF